MFSGQNIAARQTFSANRHIFARSIPQQFRIFTRVAARLLRSPAGQWTCPGCGGQLASGPLALEVDRRSIFLRTAGAPSVPNSSMARIIFSCGIGRG